MFWHSIVFVSIFFFVTCSTSGETLPFMSLSPNVSMRQIANRPFTNFRSFNRRRRGLRFPVLRQCRGRELRRYRTLNGMCNNLRFPIRGAAGQPFIILSRSWRSWFQARNLPNARRVSNIVHDEVAQRNNDRGMSELVTFFGQFIDHTVTETDTTGGTPFRIRVPADDPVFKERQFIPFFRSLLAGRGRRRAPLNLLSSYIDGKFTQLQRSLSFTDANREYRSLHLWSEGERCA